jgi:hypothetical protein
MQESSQRPVFDWGAMAPQLLPPMLVDIIEALWWIDEPLSASDLAHVCERPIFERPMTALAMKGNLRRLACVGAITVADTQRVRGALVRLYRLGIEP